VFLRVLRGEKNIGGKNKKSPAMEPGIV